MPALCRATITAQVFRPISSNRGRTHCGIIRSEVRTSNACAEPAGSEAQWPVLLTTDRELDSVLLSIGAPPLAPSLAKER
jgi:hypothetical protein